MKVIDKILNAEQTGQPYWSFEYFPPKTKHGLVKLFQCWEEMALLEPEFIDVTWGAGGSTSDLTLQLCTYAQHVFRFDTCMHLTCTHMPKTKLDLALKKANQVGIETILALRGDPVNSIEAWSPIEGGFMHATDLLDYIQTQYPTTFCLGVAGYPEGHPESLDSDLDFHYLQMKLDHGNASYIVTQLFYDVSKFLTWYQACRLKGFSCPILPGIMPITSYASFEKMTQLCRTHLPLPLQTQINMLKTNLATQEQWIQFGIDTSVSMILELWKAGIHGFHFYTMNQSYSTLQILTKLQWIFLPTPEFPVSSSLSSTVCVSLHPKHQSIQTWPIYWETRRLGYLHVLNTSSLSLSLSSFSNSPLKWIDSKMDLIPWPFHENEKEVEDEGLYPHCETKEDVIEYYIQALKSKSSSNLLTDSSSSFSSFNLNSYYFLWGSFSILSPLFYELAKLGLFFTHYVPWFPYAEFCMPYTWVSLLLSKLPSSLMDFLSIVQSPFFSKSTLLSLSLPFNPCFNENTPLVVKAKKERECFPCYTETSHALLTWTKECFQLWKWIHPTNSFIQHTLLPSYVLVSMTCTSLDELNSFLFTTLMSIAQEQQQQQQQSEILAVEEEKEKEKAMQVPIAAEGVEVDVVNMNE